MPEIGKTKTFAFGFWQSDLCDNSLAGFPAGEDFSWSGFGFILEGTDDDNYVEIDILNTDTNAVIQGFKFTERGRKIIDLSKYRTVGTTQDVYIMLKITTFI